MAGTTRSKTTAADETTTEATTDAPAADAPEKNDAPAEKAAKGEQQDVENNRDGADEMRSALEREQDRGEAHLVGVSDVVPGSLYDDADVDAMVTLKQDVIEEFRYPGTTRPAYRVLYTKGQVVQKKAIDAYNAATEARKVELTGDAAVAAYVDSTTLASGTTPGIGALEAQPTGRADQS